MCTLFKKCLFTGSANSIVGKGVLHKLHHCLAEPSKLTKEAHPVTGAGEKMKTLFQKWENNMCINIKNCVLSQNFKDSLQISRFSMVRVRSFINFIFSQKIPSALPMNYFPILIFMPTLIKLLEVASL